MRPHHRCQNYSIDKSVVMSAVMLASEYRTILTSITFYRKCFGASVEFRTNSSRSISFSSTFRQNRKLRDSSNESDEELEPPASPPPRSTIDGSKNVLPSKIKAAVSNVIQFEGQNRKNFFFIFFLRMSYFELGTWMQQDDSHRNVPIRNIISSIITSETFYVECLTKMLHVSRMNTISINST